MSQPFPIAITGLGLITAQGGDRAGTWAGVTAGIDRLRPWGEEGLPAQLAALKVARCGVIPRPADLPPRLWGNLARTQQLAAAAVDQALAEAGLPRRPEAAVGEVGLFFATTVCGMDQTERYYAQYRSNPDAAEMPLLRRVRPFEILSLLARRHRLSGPTYLNLSTCVGSAVAIGAACDWLRAVGGRVAIAGGSEALCRVLLSGFHSLKLIDPEGCKPFDVNRKGITAGEAGGAVVLEHPDYAKARGARVLAYVSGFSATCDAHHLTAPDPRATQAVRAIERALRDAGLAAKDVDYVNAHGTATRDNDAMEATALNQVFGGLRRLPFVSSTKRHTGHTFAAAGVVEAALCVSALQAQRLPPNAGVTTAEPHLKLPLALRSASAALRHVLSCNFAFGGNNAAVVLSRGDAR